MMRGNPCKKHRADCKWYIFCALVKVDLLKFVKGPHLVSSSRHRVRSITYRILHFHRPQNFRVDWRGGSENSKTNDRINTLNPTKCFDFFYFEYK